MTVLGPFKRERLHNAAGADANGNAMTCLDANGAYVAGAFQISGTVTTATIHFECTVDGTNWVAMECASSADSTVLAASATAAGVWVFTCVGFYAVRARLDWTAGSVTVWGTLVG